MSRDPDAALPPYFSISPDAALAELGSPVGTGDFAAIAEACALGRADLAGRGLGQGPDSPGGGKQLRLFSTWEITRYLIPLAPAHFRRVLRANPGLPQGRAETPGGARWFTLDEVLRLRALDPLTPQPDALERGTHLHRVMERFVAEDLGSLDGPLDLLAARGR